MPAGEGSDDLAASARGTPSASSASTSGVTRSIAAWRSRAEDQRRDGLLAGMRGLGKVGVLDGEPPYVTRGPDTSLLLTDRRAARIDAIISSANCSAFCIA